MNGCNGSGSKNDSENAKVEDHYYKLSEYHKLNSAQKSALKHKHLKCGHVPGAKDSRVKKGKGSGGTKLSQAFISAIVSALKSTGLDNDPQDESDEDSVMSEEDQCPKKKAKKLTNHNNPALKHKDGP